MSVPVLIVGILSLLVTKQVVSVDVSLEGENAKVEIISRSEASNLKTLQLDRDDKASFIFCLVSDALVKVKNIRYSNDGGSDSVDVIINDGQIGSFQSTAGSNNGANWNQFQLSGDIGQVSLNAGLHKLYLDVSSADPYGIEIDNIQFTIDNEQDQESFTCIGQSVSIEGENVDGQFEINTRSSASNSQAVKLSRLDVASYSFCVSSTTRLVVDNIFSSNDGDADTMRVHLDGNELGSFQSIAGSNYGYNWNTFYASGQIGTEQTVESGQHTITITVESADTYGVEIDRIQMTLLGNGIDQNNINCALSEK